MGFYPCCGCGHESDGEGARVSGLCASEMRSERRSQRAWRRVMLRVDLRSQPPWRGASCHRWTRGYSSSEWPAHGEFQHNQRNFLMNSRQSRGQPGAGRRLHRERVSPTHVHHSDRWRQRERECSCGQRRVRHPRKPRCSREAAAQCACACVLP